MRPQKYALSSRENQRHSALFFNVALARNKIQQPREAQDNNESKILNVYNCYQETLHQRRDTDGLKTFICIQYPSGDQFYLFSWLLLLSHL